MVSEQLIQSLGRIRRQAKLLAVGYGIGAVIIAAIGLALSVVLVDYVLNLPAWPRVVAMGLAAVALVAACVNWLWRPARMRISLSDVAGKVETVFPAFEDRLRSVVEYSQTQVPGSDAMKQRVVAQTNELAQTVDFGHALVSRPTIAALLSAAAAALLVILVGSLVAPAYSKVAIARLMSPFAEQPWPKRQRIDLVTPAPGRMVAGQRLDLKMRLGQGDRSSLRAIVYSQVGDGPVQQQLMQRESDGTYAAGIDTPAPAGADAAAPGALKVWIRSGDDEARLQPIQLVQPLLISRVHAEITPPAYVTEVPPTKVNLASTSATAAVGSTIRLDVGFNKPVIGAITLEPIPPPGPTTAPAAEIRGGEEQTGDARQLTLAAETSTKFRIRATDADGFSNSAIEEYELIVRPDQLPTIQIESPRGSEARTADAVVPLAAVAEDDYGISGVELVVERLGDQKIWTLPMVQSAQPTPDVGWLRETEATERQRFRMTYGWELSALDGAALKPGDVLEIHLRATDNFALTTGGQLQKHPPQPSGRVRITIISQEDLANSVMDEMRVARGQISEVAKAQNRVRGETADLAGETANAEQLDAGQRATSARLAGQQSTAAAQSRQLSQRLDAARQRLEENRSPRTDLGELARDVAGTLERASEGPMKEAAQQLSGTAQAGMNQQQRNQALEKAQERQQTAGQQLQGAMDKLGDLGSLQQSIEKVGDILKEQQKISAETADIGKANLGKRPEQMSAEERKKLDDVAQRQAALAERTAAAISQMQKQADQMAKSDPAAAEAMKQAAQAGQQQQVSPNQQKAAQQAKQNQQTGAQQAQKQAEIGLQQMLQNLQDAERRKLAELQQQLADLQKQVNNLIRRQASHNLDNLALQGGDRLKELDSAVLRDLLAKAARNAEAAPPVPALTQLAAGQEQTERNTRDIAKAIDGVPSVEEVPARLLRAAGRMERANVHLRQNELPAAYDPPQVEALAALEDAKKLVDEAKDKVDQKIEQQRREAIRAVYERVKVAQQKLNADTARIDAAPRNADGSMKREDLIRLGQMPGEQGKLSDEIKALEERLGALGSVVYTWANADIVTSMDEIKEMLGKQAVGRPTRLQQTRVVRQLDEMINSLQENPIQSKFAQDGGGGGGGQQQGGSRLPSEAELRLLKGLQGAVNDQTAELAQAGQRDEASVRGLGTRQGQLRQLLGELLEKSSRGEIALGPEPDNRDQLPEEAGEEDIENQELDKELLQGEGDVAAEEKKAVRVGDRMARVRQRLAMNNDPGKTTQAIQKRIQDDLDILIEQARRQQAQTRNSDQQSQPSETQTKSQPKPGEQAQGENQGGQQQATVDEAAQESTTGGGLGKTGKPGQDIKESLREWGSLSPRQRDAIIEGSGENVIEAYKKLVDDYYKSLATKAAEK